ncbi:ammonia-dependent NAD(+) synthetase [Paraburkholderia silviterrae]|uniref:NH(3)-dependent NAD(+) synthetase n=2 Tax=Paraburkholderia silviterrae TaxID=2528715 RepID=A0A4R5LYJ2_9BURK|nr:ammonia-dependent NAD(+) synthetase [Paraburkholderia silviterrae]TDG17178.1 ammonia-dependent NAD(+) synthetase [Paraburkholderia silviterrae]
MREAWQHRQREIAAELNVATAFSAPEERGRRIAFLADCLRASGLRTLVLGISGGIDSATAGRLAQLAAVALRAEGHEARFIAMRLPYGTQQDEADAAESLAFIDPDETSSADVAPPADAMLASLTAGGLKFADAAQQDFVLGNIKARQRMIAQYAVAGARAGLVIGTDHAAESLMGFFTKFGDGGADVLPLAGLTKRRVRALARLLGAPGRLVDKIPTADLETLRPLRSDEDAYGVSYEEIDDFLEGKPVSDAAYATILRFYDTTRHKRALPYTPYDPMPGMAGK